jgi:DNA-binding MarR family transcriptional regulator
MLHTALQSLIATGADLTIRQVAMLSTIATTGADDARTVRALAATLGLSKPAITRAADKLEDLGWAQRIRDPLDHRSVFVRPTPAGRRAIAPLLALDATERRAAA